MSPPRIVFSAHALDRYIERVRPGAAKPLARKELAHLSREGEVVAEAPPWFAPEVDGEPVVGYLVLGDVAFPLYREKLGHLVAVTCVVPGSLPDGTRRARSERRRGRRYRAKAARRNERTSGRRPSPALGEEEA